MHEWLILHFTIVVQCPVDFKSKYLIVPFHINHAVFCFVGDNSSFNLFTFDCHISVCFGASSCLQHCKCVSLQRHFSSCAILCVLPLVVLCPLDFQNT